ncbi:hypothetical protein W911_14635 [Hyphomicrobium nitrativorans NL23]|uniref:Uncharacterized protein n=1 Tax=Hyphomicrobium nitrativorans NL23 TaxID=1029756 RepID=V5SK65_9HYPH|nr:hypothetical protein [Hyphomicrobium nitrativorans]AHB50349.1 hypothetical protein W911_14635 [Hyphomicrobium nitrativorans NL23]
MLMMTVENIPDDLRFIPMRMVAKALCRRDLRAARGILIQHGIPIIKLSERSDGTTLAGLRQLLAKGRVESRA